jgi:hypothetical protein
MIGLPPHAKAFLGVADRLNVRARAETTAIVSPTYELAPVTAW